MENDEDDIFKYAEEHGKPVTENELLKPTNEIPIVTESSIDITNMSKKELRKVLKNNRLIRRNALETIKKLRIQNKVLLKEGREIKKILKK